MNENFFQRPFFPAIYLAIFVVILTGLLILIWPDPVAQNRPDAGENTAGLQYMAPDSSMTVIFPDSTAFQEKTLYQVETILNGNVLLIPLYCDMAGIKYFMLVLLVGALGACLHGISSLAYWAGFKKYSSDWLLWYLLRPFTGALLALLLYFIVRGGFLPHMNGGSASFYGILGLSGLFGLCSKQALNMLSKLFDVIFIKDSDAADSQADASATPGKRGGKPPNS